MSDAPAFDGLSVGQAQRVCVPLLKDAAIDDPVLEARLLLAFVLGGGPERVLADRDEILSPVQSQSLSEALTQRCARVPMSHIVGQREFWSLRFKVTSATLTPRPDTETLIEAVLEHVPGSAKRVLDLGTGTGCILLALLSEWPNARGTGVDASAAALAVAGDNAKALGFEGRADFVLGDWNVDDWDQDLATPFDVVVSNPPYIPAQDIEGLEPDVRDHEPRSALDGGADGLNAYRAIVAQLDKLLSTNGFVAFEVGIDQADDVADLLAAAGLKVVDKRSDLGGVARVVVAQKA